MGKGSQNSMTLATYLAICILCPVAHGQGTAIEMCLNKEPQKLQDHRGVGNFAFTARVFGSTDESAKGYFIVAIEPSGAGWIQANTGIQPVPGKFDQAVRFGVSNVSAYPLRFVVLQADVSASFNYAELARKARGLIFLDMDSSSTKARVVTSRGKCVVDLENGTPRVPKDCACP